MEEGDPCFLYLSAGADGKAASGIIGRGVVTGTAEMDWGSGGVFWRDQAKATAVTPYAPVEILPLANRVLRADLVAHPALGKSQLIKAPLMGNPVVLRHDELAALDDLCGDVVQPSDDQLAALAEDEWMPSFAMADGDLTYVVDDHGEEDGFVVWVESAGASVEDRGTFRSVTEAVASLVDVADEVGRRAPIVQLLRGDDRVAEVVPQGEESAAAAADEHEEVTRPYLAFLAVDGESDIVVARLGESDFAGLQGEDAGLIGRFATLGQAIVGLSSMIDEAVGDDGA